MSPARRVRDAAPAAGLPDLRDQVRDGPSSSCRPIEVLQVPDGHLVLQTLRSHDQFNTTIYGLSDRYRGIEGGRRVVFVHPDDIERAGLRRRRHASTSSPTGRTTTSVRRAQEFRIVAYDTPRGSRRGVLPRDQPAGSAGFHRAGQQLLRRRSRSSLGWNGRDRQVRFRLAVSNRSVRMIITSPIPSHTTCPRSKPG